MLFILVGILLISLVSAADWDNLKIYNEKEEKITLYNWNVIGLIFNIKLVEYTMDYNTDQCLINCNAGGTAKLYNKGTLFDSLEFKNKKGQEESIEGYQIFLKKNITSEIDVMEYIEVCEVANITEQLCKDVATGKTHKEDLVKEEWVEYKGEVLDEGNYVWKLEGIKELNQDIDWIFTIRGKRFTNWAWWNTDWTKCKDLSIETSVNKNSWIAELNITGLTFSNITELRIVSASCRDDGSEVKSTILQNGSDWAVMTWLVNSSGSSLNYSVYYDNPTDPAKSSDLELVDEFCEFETDNCGYTNYTQPGEFYYSDGKAYNGETGGFYSPITGVKNLLSRTFAPTYTTNNVLMIGLHNTTGTFPNDIATVPEGLVRSVQSDDAWMLGNADGVISLEYVTTGAQNKWVTTFEKLLVGNATLWDYASTGLQGVGNISNTIDDVNLRILVGTRIGNGDVINIWDYVRAYDTESEYIFDGLYNITLGAEEESTGIVITLNNPLNNTKFVTNTIEINCSVAVTGITLNNISLYIDGSLNVSNDVTGVFNESVQTLTFDDGNYEWTCSVTDDLDAVYWADTNYTFNVNTTPNIQYESPTPIDYFNSSIDNFVVNVSLNETYFQNITFNLHNTTDVYNSSFFEDGTRFINWSVMEDGNYTYNVTIWTTTNQQNSTETRNIVIDTTLPTMNITYPLDTIDYHITGNNLSINWSVSDPHLDSCWGSFDFGTNNISLTCVDNSFVINITSVNNDTFTFYANDSFGNIANISKTWIYKIFEAQQTFSPITIVGSTETFVNNFFLGSGETITEVVFDYNGTEKSATSVNVGGSEYNLTSTFIIPSVPSIANMTFFWNIALISGEINTSGKNQTINVVSIDDCSVYTNLIFNYTIIDEGNQSRLANNSNLELDISIFDESKTVFLLNFSEEYDNINPALVCLSINLTSDTVYAIDSTVKYQADNYSIEYYNIQNFLMRNSTIPQTINLFDLWKADATEFQITFKDSNFVTVENALIQINRQYLSEGLFKTVEIPKTDSNGQTVAHLVEKDAVYNIIVLKEGEVIGTFNNIIAFCEDILIGSCFITLNALAEGEVAFEYDEDIGLLYDFDYDETSRNLQFDFSTTDGSVKNVTLSAIKFDQLGNTTVCNGHLISSSGSIFCPVPISVGNESIIVSIFVDGDLKITNYISAGTEFDIGDAGYFLMFFLVLSLALMMTQSKTGVIVGVLLGFISGILLSFIKGGLMGIGSSVIWLIIMGVILIYKLNSQGQT